MTSILREVVAGIIDPTAKFQDLDGVRWSQFEIERRELAYRKADSILSLLPSPAATPPSGSAVAMRDDLKKTINGALRIFFADDRAPTKSELYLIEKATEHLVAALAAPQAQDEPNHEGIDFALEQLCTFLGVDPHMVSWDAATETVDGDVQAVIGNIMRTKYGEDFDAKASVAATPAQDVRQILHDHFYTGEPGQHEAIEAALIRLAGSVATVRRHEAKERAYQAARDNLREAWAAISMIRETIETLAPSGAVKAAEHLDGPTFMHEADALVAGILAMVSRPLHSPTENKG